MSQISLKSISGITSITTPAGVDNQFTLHTNNTSQALKLDSAGNIHVHNHINTTGISSASNFKTGSSNLHSTGLTVGNNFLHSTGINVGTGATIHVPATNVLTLGTNGNERLRIRSDGNIGINNVGDASWKLKLVVPDNASYQTAFNVTNNVNSDFNVVIKSNLTAIGSGTNTPLALFTNGNANERFRIGSSGQFGIGGATYGTSGQVLTSGGASAAPTWATPSSGVTVSGNANNRIITGDGTNLVGENLFQYNDSNGTVTLTAPEGGDASIHMNADENDDMFDRYKLVSGADNHFQMYQMGAGGGWESRVKFHSARGNIEPIHDTIGLHGCLLYTSPSPRDRQKSRMPSSA